ncbi:FkbM family methyltransferase [Candidatus Gracilibacteria bacterium]|nr:FkbM family methyltransferase [Candidatus Gracilibacteria bacterium]
MHKLKLQLETIADKSVYDEVFRDHDYGILDDIIKKAQMPILDIGAHIGLFSLYAATLNPQIQIHAFEPDTRNYQKLKDHLKENKIKNVTPKNLALSDQVGECDFYLSEDSHNHSLIPITEAPIQKIHTTTLEKITAKQSSLAKIDIEGAEFPVILNSTDQTLRQIHNYCIEYHADPEPLIARLQKIGYKTQKFPSRYDKRFGLLLATS